MNPDRQHRMNRSGSPSRREKESTRRDTSNRVSKSSRSRRQPKAVAKNKVAASYVSSDEQARRFVAEEDNFVLRQSKKKAVIRVRERRAQPIDFLAYSLRYVDEEEEMRDVFDGEDGEGDGREDVVDVPDPAAVVQGIWDLGELATLESEIGSYHVLETDGRNREYWEALRSLCEAQRARVDPRGRDRRAVVSGAVAADIDGILAPKTHEELGQLERQIREKLRGAEEGDEDVDTDYWEQLLQSLGVWKAKAVLARTVDKMMKKKAERRSRQVGQEDYAARTGRRNGGNAAVEESVLTSAASGPATATKPAPESRSAPETAPETSSEVALSEPAASTSTSVPAASTLLAPDPNGQTDVSSVTQTLYDREAARGIQDNEEVFAAEEELPVMARPKWAGKHRVRKPRYFNRVQMGYEWNKYNQTHYDHENPPPKVVQGYKFNIFYPELIDKTKAPTFKIIREHGRRRGESFAAAGEEDTCLIRFIAGPPYTDIAFRIVDREWDYSAKRDRGFRSSFDKGILQLHFQFKKIFYRK